MSAATNSDAISFRQLRLVLWAIFGAVLGVIAAVLWKHTGDPLDYFRYQFPPAQFLFVLVKVSGLTAMAFLVFQVVLAMMRKRLNITTRQHIALGLITLTLILFHVACFVIAVSIRNKAPAYDLLWPNFHNYYRTWLSVGLIGLWMLCLGIAAMLHGDKWRSSHPWLMLIGLSLVYLHSLQVGSETRASAMTYVYWGYLLAVLSSLIIHIRSTRTSSRPSR